MTRSDSIRCSDIFRAAMMVAALVVPSAAQAQWEAAAGAETRDHGIQAFAFLPNELWIHVNDSVQWTFPTEEIHTVTFLKSGQVRPPFPVGCPPPASGSQPSGSSFNNSACVNSGILLGGATYSVTFPTAGNYKLVCLVHSDMTGVVHVLNLGQPLPHFQPFYDRQAADQAHDLLSDDRKRGNEERAELSKEFSGNVVIAGIGEVITTGGGRQNQSVMRFFHETIRIHVGETVEWTNLDPVTPHTVTFGTEPLDPMALVNVITDADGARHGTINSASDNVNSGFLLEAAQDRVGLAQTPPGVTRIRVTFNHEGTYRYICALHDDIGMTGKVVVAK